MTVSVLLTFKLHYSKYKVYNTAVSHRPIIRVCLPFYSHFMFCGYLVHFLDLISVLQLNQHRQQFAYYAFYHFLVCDPQCWVDASSVSNFFNDDRDQLLFENSLINFFATKLFSWCKTFIKTLSSLLKTIVCYCLQLHVTCQWRQAIAGTCV